METRLTLRPGEKRTKKLVARSGERLALRRGRDISISGEPVEKRRDLGRVHFGRVAPEESP